MKVGVIGSGGREHAICETLKKSNKIDKIFCFPGNAGTKDIAKNIKFQQLVLAFLKTRKMPKIF